MCVFHRYSGVLSAYGLALADVVEEVQEPCSLQYEQCCFTELDRRVEQLSKRCCDTLCARGFTWSAPTKHCMFLGEPHVSNAVLICPGFSLLREPLMLAKYLILNKSWYIVVHFDISTPTKAALHFSSSSAVRLPLRSSSTCVTRELTVLSWLMLQITSATPSPVEPETSTVPSPKG